MILWTYSARPVVSIPSIAMITIAAKALGCEPQRIAKTLDLPAPSVRLGVSNLLREVEHLNRELKIPSTLKAWGATPEQLKEVEQEIISAALADVTTSSNPRPATAECVEAILHRLSGF